jgi:predicted secreted protein
MAWTSALAIYLLFWVMSAFMVLPFHGRQANQPADAMVGTDPGAPSTFRIGAILKQTTIVATISFAAYYIVYTQGWIDAAAIGLMFTAR